MQIRITRPARKHRIGNARILEALANAGLPVSVEGDALHYLGADDRGIELELIVVPDDKRPGGFSVIHAMPTDYRN